MSLRGPDCPPSSNKDFYPLIITPELQPHFEQDVLIIHRPCSNFSLFKSTVHIGVLKIDLGVYGPPSSSQCATLMFYSPPFWFSVCGWALPAATTRSLPFALKPHYHVDLMFAARFFNLWVNSMRPDHWPSLSLYPQHLHQKPCVMTREVSEWVMSKTVEEGG